MSKRTLLFVPVETKVRELHGKILFSLAAVEKGFDVILGGQQELVAKIGSFDRGIYIDKSATEIKKRWFPRCAALGNSICAWDDEGLVFFDEDTYREFRFCEEAFNLTEMFFAWGEVQARSVCGKNPEHRRKVVISGNPRFDLLRPELRAFYEPAAAQRRRQFGRILLFNTSFPFANYFQGETGLKRRLENFPISRKPGFFEGWTDLQYRCLVSFKEILPVLSRKYAGHTIIVRPHPSEDFDIWRRLAADLPNVLVTGEGNVHEWLLASDVMVHSNCTTGIEAFLLDVPSVAYRKERSDCFEQPLPNRLSLHAFDPEGLVKMLDEIIEKGARYPRLKEDKEMLAFAGQHIASIDGPFASDVITEALKAIRVGANPPRVEPEPPVPLVKQAWRLVLKCVRRPDPMVVRYHRQKFPGFDVREVRESVARLQAIAGRFADVSVRSAGRNIVAFTA